MMPPRVVVESCLLERGATGIQLSNDTRKLQIYAAGFEEHALNMLQPAHLHPWMTRCHYVQSRNYNPEQLLTHLACIWQAPSPLRSIPEFDGLSSAALCCLIQVDPRSLLSSGSGNPHLHAPPCGIRCIGCTAPASARGLYSRRPRHRPRASSYSTARSVHSFAPWRQHLAPSLIWHRLAN